LKGYRIFIFSHDHPHPPHVHFGKRKRVSSWDLTLKICHEEDGFSATEIREQRRMLIDLQDAIWRSWHEHWQRQK
jgi:hypothetical protein